MVSPRSREIKHAQRESQLCNLIANFLHQIICDDQALSGLSLHKVSLSPDRRQCFVLLYTIGGLEKFEEQRPQLVLYKPSLQRALAKSLEGRKIPDIRFIFDAQFEKQQRIVALLDKVKEQDEERKG